MADLLDMIMIVCSIIMLVGGVYYVVFTKKSAEQVLPNSKMANLSIEERIKRIRIAGIFLIIAGAYFLWQTLS
jgi:hypothetical protein